MDINKLTPEEIKVLEAKIKEQKKAERERIQKERETYKEISTNVVKELFPKLTEMSRQMVDLKKQVFDSFAATLALKGELYGVKDSQKSHTFSTENNNISITIGYRETDDYDDTVHAGIEKVRKYVYSLAKDAETGALVQTVLDLLKADQKGNLKASRMLELRKLANQVRNQDFSDGIQIIEDSYKPVRSCQFVTVTFKDETGKEHSLPLSMSAID